MQGENELPEIVSLKISPTCFGAEGENELFTRGAWQWLPDERDPPPHTHTPA